MQLDQFALRHDFLNLVRETVLRWQEVHKTFKETLENTPIPKEFALWIVENNPKNMINIGNIQIAKDAFLRLIDEDVFALVKNGSKLNIQKI